MAQSPIERQIIAGARARGIDPQAALAVARVEGLGGGVGDQGTSFGPWQLHVGGAFPTGRVPHGQEQAWAMSPAGINYALGQIGGVARGLHGPGAVNAIVRRFERPANPDAEVQKALGLYGSGGATSAIPAGISSPYQPQQQGLPPIVASLFAQNQQALGAPTPPALLAGLLGPSGTTRAPTRTRTPSGPTQLGNVTLASGADRAGARTGKGILGFARRVAGVYGQPLKITTGTNHNEYVAGTHRESAHWKGNAVDIAASGPELMRMGRAALAAAGMDPKQAAKAPGGLYNVGGYQIIFGVSGASVGGDHTNHMHLGLRG